MRAIRKVTSSDLLTKQAMEKKKNNLYYIQKNMYILALLLSVVTARIEAVVVCGNKFLYGCVKEVCCL
jgi:hypothetical protein